MTVKVQHLSKAPIVEAIIAFALEKPLTESDAVFEKFYAIIRSDYPTRDPVKVAHLTVNEQGSSGDTQIVGARFASADGKRVCLIDRSNFICSRLAPYETWESLKSEFERLWRIYSPMCNGRIARVGVRYINKIFLPEGKDMSLTVRTRPEIAEGLPQTMFNFFVRLGVKIPDPQGDLMITETQLPTERPGFVTAVLDHDLQFPINPESTDVWLLLDKARELKNDYFFASVSENLIKEYV
jgi:uncharacterized protein (TIGR04255 family)